MNMLAIPAPTSTTKDNGRWRTKEKARTRIGKKNDPKVRRRPLKLKLPKEAMIRAPMRAPTPRADCSQPFVVASPPRTLTAQAGNKTAKETPKRLVTTIKLLTVRT